MSRNFEYLWEISGLSSFIKLAVLWTDLPSLCKSDVDGDNLIMSLYIKVMNNLYMYIVKFPFSYAFCEITSGEAPA